MERKFVFNEYIVREETKMPHATILLRTKEEDLQSSSITDIKTSIGGYKVRTNVQTTTAPDMCDEGLFI